MSRFTVSHKLDAMIDALGFGVLMGMLQEEKVTFLSCF